MDIALEKEVDVASSYRMMQVNINVKTIKANHSCI
jgi:hypothetical protein